VLRAAVWNQLLWTAGYPLTSGGFLLYFASDLGARGFLTSLLLALPELVGAGAVLTRPLIVAAGYRKRVWGVCGVLARLASLAIPLMTFPELRPPRNGALWVLVGALAVSQVLQAISYVAYLSWLSDLVPEERWGRFFATRNVARLVVMLLVPIAVGVARDRWVRGLAAETALIAYVVAWVAGTALQVASMVPLLRLPESRTDANVLAVQNPCEESDHAPERTVLRWARPGFGASLTLLIVHNLWLAFSNGLTQAAFFEYRKNVLGISLAVYYVLENTTTLVMIPVSLAAGRISDRYGNKWLLFWGAVIAAGAMPFWLVASPAHWTLVFGAQVFWGAFAAVNLAGSNLLLKLAPRSANTLQLAMFQQGGGLLAGLSGLLGGWWLQQLLPQQSFHFAGGTWNAYQVVFLASFIGRLTAPLCVLPIREPPPHDSTV
jgi:MFS family permease